MLFQWFAGIRRTTSARLWLGAAILGATVLLGSATASHSQEEQSRAPSPEPAATMSSPPAQTDAAPSVPPSAETAVAELPRDLTPYGMFMSADIVVKAVMLGLLVASMLTWTIWLAKTLELFGVRRHLRRAQRALNEAWSLAEAAPA